MKAKDNARGFGEKEELLWRELLLKGVDGPMPLWEGSDVNRFDLTKDHFLPVKTSE